jgi:SAM-dependent methyltransferase
MTDWESLYQAGDMPWDKGGASPGLVDYLATHRIFGRVLVPGCGLGHDVRAISCAENEVIGLDIAPSGVRLAASFPRVANEHYVAADFLDLPPELRGAFDWLWEHTCFCAINPAQRPDYAAAAAAALKSGGHFLAVFYMDPDHGGENEPPWGATTRELDTLFGGNFALLDEWRPARNYESRAGRELMRLMRRR